ncbi:MAG TPA: tail fiber domain-containing protein, partial [Bacteroidia bacterium]|nr:tail fiber domain-containing protein [Bacteroidia bacterium]
CFSQIRGAAVNIGYFANAKEPANQNIGADLNVSGGTIINYGVRASAPVVSCLPTLCNNAAGYFNGDVFFNRPFTLSDSSLKQNVQPISNSKQVLMALQPKSFEYTQSFGNKSPLNLSTGTHYGLLAQELQSILPNLVKQFAEPEQTDSNGVITKTMNEFLSVNYIELIPFLIKGYQQQQLQIDSLIAASNPNPIPKQNQNSPSEQRLQIELSDAQGIILNQNDPNPFAEHTVISYFIPEHIVEAKIIFFTSSGNIVQQIKILERGAGVLDVYASDLSSGIYTYSLIADGKVIDTKRMVKIK